jgi:pimeloyl-ACP methyl ester carboxylesterase
MTQADASAIRDGYADLSEVRLHYVEAGEGPLVVLLHGFPEFWYGWRHQIPALAEAGFRVVAPDMRGYNLSSKPAGVAAYDTDRLAGDIRDLIAERGAERALLAGHDWGGAVAWSTAMNHGEVVERLAILNCPHPRRFLTGVRKPRQAIKSRYMFFFQLPWLPERFAASGDWRWLRVWWLGSAARPSTFSAEDIARYVEAWEQPGAVAAAINYYRAVFRQTPRKAMARIRTVEAPTLVIWGERDRYLGRELAEPDRSDVPNLERVIRLPAATHWVQHEEPAEVSRLLAGFFASGSP